MGNCWEVLGIPPTNDVEAIKKAYRALIKQWHPDTANGDEKEKYTNRSAEINVAYDDAIRLAEGWSSNVSRAGFPNQGPFTSHRVYRYDFHLTSSTFLSVGLVLAVLAFTAIVFLGPLVEFLSGCIFALIVNACLRPIVRYGLRAKREALMNLILFGLDTVIVSVVFADWSFPFKLAVMLSIPIRVLRRNSRQADFNRGA